ncbi:MAG: hypothetical protein ACXVQY_07775 [Actinomycetota bacterium]
MLSGSEVRRRWRRATQTPFGSDAGPAALVHCGHHRAGSVWFRGILEEVAAQFGLTFFSTYLPVVDPPEGERPPTATADVVQFMHSRHFRDDLFAGRSIRGSHIVRDPRDIAVSAYRYHLWSDEPWVNTPAKTSTG